MAPSLQSMLTRSVLQVMGLDEVMNRARERSYIEGDLAAQEGNIEAAKTLGSAQGEIAKMEGEVKKEQARSERGAGIWGAVLTGVGAAAGATFLPGMTAGASGGGMTAMQGAQLGASIGNAVSGGQASGNALSGAINTYAGIEQTNKYNALKSSLTTAQTNYYNSQAANKDANTNNIVNNPKPDPASGVSAIADVDNWIATNNPASNMTKIDQSVKRGIFNFGETKEVQKLQDKWLEDTIAQTNKMIQGVSTDKTLSPSDAKSIMTKLNNFRNDLQDLLYGKAK